MGVQGIMEGRWTGNMERDQALDEAIEATQTCYFAPNVLAEEFAAETDARLASTLNRVPELGEASHAAAMALMLWESCEPETLRAVIADCVLACELAADEFRLYLPEEGGHVGDLSLRALHRIRRTCAATEDCHICCTEFIRVWFGAGA